MKQSSSHSPEGIAIIGIAARFARARTLASFWRNLRGEGGRPAGRSEQEAASHATPGTAAETAVDQEAFDGHFFGITPSEAALMDPQHRVLLECSWAALEDAGHDVQQESGHAGVFVSTGPSTCLLARLTEPWNKQQLIASLLANEKDALPLRISEKLNLRGPSMSVQCGAASPLAAVCLAAQQLLTHQCDLALAGGASLAPGEDASTPKSGNGGAEDCNGHAEPALTEGEGAAIFVLKRLSEAVADRDPIYAVIKGFALGHAGTAVGGDDAQVLEARQAESAALAQALAEADAGSIGYVEAYGSDSSQAGGQLLAVLNRIYQGQAPGVCALGRLETGIGPTGAAALLAGLLRAALALHHKQIPPGVSSTGEGQKLELTETPFYSPNHLAPWQSKSESRRAAVSAFGEMNATLVLEEAPARPAAECSGREQLILLSAKTPAALERRTADLVAYLEGHPNESLEDAAYTLQAGRRAFPHRRALVCRDAAEAVKLLKTLEHGRVRTATGTPAAEGVVFLFPGEAAVRVNMGRELYEAEPYFREQLDLCADFLRPQLGLDLRPILFPAAGQAQEAQARLMDLNLAQPALFAVEYALAKLWLAWGIHPKGMLGYGPGEYVAAALAGVFSLKEALLLASLKTSLLSEHSRTIAAPPLVDLVRQIRPRPPRIPYLSSVTGAWITPEQATDPAYWSEHFSQPVRAADALKQLLRQPGQILLEVGPGQSLTTLASQRIRSDHEPFQIGTEPQTIASLLAGQEQPTEPMALLHALGRLWLHGVEVNWQDFHSSAKHRRLHLPTYPFERQAVSSGLESAGAQRTNEVKPAISLAIETREIPVPVRIQTTADEPRPAAAAELTDGLVQDLLPASPTLRSAMPLRPGNGNPRDETPELPAVARNLRSVSEPRLAYTPDQPQLALEDKPDAGLKAPSYQLGPVLKTLPLTEAQREIWYGAQVSDAVSCSFNLAILVNLKGRLELARLIRTFEWLIERHEALRVTFPPTGDIQQVHAPGPIDAPVTDLSLLLPQAREEELDRLLREDVNVAFDLVKGPMFRFRLIKRADEDHALLLTAHHIICDGGSLGVLIQELGERFTADAKGEPGPSEVPQAFSEFIREQEAAAGGPERAKSEEFWLQQYSRPAPILNLPTDYPRPQRREFTGGTGKRVLTRELTAGIKRLSSRQRCTLVTTMLAAYYVLLHRLTGETDLVIGLPMTGRSGDGSERLVAHSVNFLPLRLKLEGDPTFAELTARVWSLLLDAHEHRNCTLGNLLQKLNLARDASRMPLASVMFNLDWVQDTVALEGLKVDIKPNPYAVSRFDMTLSAAEAEGQLELYSLYSAELLAPETIQRWLHHYENLLTAAVTDPSQRLSQLPLLAAHEQEQILRDWSQPRPELIGQLPADLKHSVLEANGSTRVYVLDAYGQPCPIGVAGELVLSAPAGSFGRPAQPEPRSDPFRSDTGAQLTPTGLRARYLADGRVHVVMPTGEGPTGNSAGGSGEESTAAQAPVGPTEESLAQIWKEVIALEEVGRNDNFFDLGGHSVLLMQIITRVRKSFGVDLTLRDLFEAPTVAELAKLVEEQRGELSGIAE